MRFHTGMLIVFNVLAAWTWSFADSPYPIRFQEVTKESGLEKPLIGIMGHGGAWGDFDGDGKPDLFVGGFCDRPDAEYKPAKGPVPACLFRNLGEGRFELVDQPAARFYGRTSGAVFADLDNDGVLELYVANNAKGRGGKGEIQVKALAQRSVLLQLQKEKWIDRSKESQTCPDTLLTARNIGVFDYNNDGLLDLFVVEDRFTAKPRSTLFRNKGRMLFEDVTSEVGLPEDIFGLGLAVADLNDDLRPDFFVPHSNRLFLSVGKEKYREATELKGVLEWKPLDKEDWPCGAQFADLNRDGKLDLVLSIHSVKARNKVYINEGLRDGIPQFRDVTKAVGLDEQIPTRCPHVEIQDFDNDGWPDLYLSSGWLNTDDQFLPLIYWNQGSHEGLPRFVSPKPVRDAMVYFPAGPSADFDLDGRLDLFMINWFQGNHCRLLKNDSPKRSFLQVQIRGNTVNRMGIGCIVQVYRSGQMNKPEGLLGMQQVQIGHGYASGQPAVCHFGLGNEQQVDLVVTFPNGKKQQAARVNAGFLTVEEKR
jgi:hypothetical protein